MIVSHSVGGEETKATPTEIDFSNNSYRNVIHLMLMSIAVHSLTVMKSTPSQLPDRQQNLDQTHSLGHTPSSDTGCSMGYFSSSSSPSHIPLWSVACLYSQPRRPLEFSYTVVAVMTSPVAAVSESLAGVPNCRQRKPPRNDSMFLSS